MNVTKTVKGGFQATKAKVNRYDVYNDKIVAHLCLYKDAAAVEAGDRCDSYSYPIQDIAGYDGTKAWVEAQIPANLDA